MTFQDQVYDPYAQDSRYDAAIAVIGSRINALDELRSSGIASSPLCRNATSEINILVNLREDLETRAVAHVVEQARTHNSKESYDRFGKGFGEDDFGTDLTGKTACQV